MSEQLLPAPYFNLLRYVPDILLDNYLQSTDSPISPPQVYPFRALLLHTNLLHFSQITQHFLSKHPNGLEIVASLHKKYVELTQQYIGPTGGDMLKYTTDRLVFYWSIPSNNAEDYLAELCRIIVYQLVKLREALAYHLQYEEISPGITFILTTGNLSIVLLGHSNEERKLQRMASEYTYAGQSFLESLEDNLGQTENMSIYVNNAIGEKINWCFYLQEAQQTTPGQSNRSDYYEIKSKPSKFFAVKNLKENIGKVPSVDPLYFKNEITLDKFEAIQDIITKSIPKYILPYAVTDTETWSSELRQATILFINIPVDLGSLSSEPQILRLQQTVQIIQDAAYMHQGNIYRTYIDKTGFNVFLVFGLHPQGNSEASANAVIAGSLLVQTLENDEIAAFMGISTGQIIISIAGEYRKDPFLIGEPLYMSYLLSLMALKEREKRIFVDHETKLQAEDKVSFCTYENSLLTGKIAQGIFEPLYSNDILPIISQNSFPEVRTHHFNVEYEAAVTEEDYQDSLFMVGREDKVHKGRQLVSQFVKAPMKMNMLLVTGPFGSGKSLLIRNMLESVQDMLKEKFLEFERPSIIVSSLDPAKKRKRLNGWRGVMKTVLESFSNLYDVDKGELLEKILEREGFRKGSSHLTTVRNIFGVKRDMTMTQRSWDSLDSARNEENENVILEVMVTVLQYFVGEKSLTQNQGEDDERFPPLIVCLEDLQDHDATSWKLLARIAEKIRRIFIIGVLREEDEDQSQDVLFMGFPRANPLLLPDLKGSINSEICMELLQDRESLEAEKRRQKVQKERRDVMEWALRSLSSRPGIQFNTLQLSNLTQTQMQEVIGRILEGKKISEELIRLLIKRSGCNPLITTDLLGNFLKQDLLQNLNREWFPTETLRKLTKLEQYIEIYVPVSIYKKAITILDSLSFVYLSLLKLASAIGNTFDFKSLVISNTLYHNMLPNSVLLPGLQKLCELKIIQIANKSEKNIVYKFTSAFLRETAYQLLPFTLRKAQHQMIASDWLLGSSSSIYDEEHINYQKTLADMQGDFGENLSERNRTIKSINTILLTQQSSKRNEDIFKAANLQKASKKEEKQLYRYVTLTKSKLKYYKTERDFCEKPALETASILLKNIISVVKLKIFFIFF